MSNPYWFLFEQTGLVESYLLYRYADHPGSHIPNMDEDSFRGALEEFGEEFAQPIQKEMQKKRRQGKGGDRSRGSKDI